MDAKKQYEINNLAKLFYRMMGFETTRGFEFSESKHPQE